MTEKQSTPSHLEYSAPSRTDTFSSTTKLDLDIESQPSTPQPPPRPSWVERLKMAYSRRASRRPDTHSSPPPSPPPPSKYPDFPDYGVAEAGPSKKVRLAIDTEIGPASARPPFPASQSGLSIQDEEDKQPNMLILLREDYFSIRNFWRTADRKDILRKIVARRMWKWYAILIVAVVLSVLLSVKHTEVVHWCHPIARKIRSWPAGFMIPIVLLVIVSYPPLVGHEIIGILIGLVWDLGKGFAILAAGTFIGEIALWISFKWCCQARAAKFEKKNSLYSSLTTLIREKTFMFVLILRFSAVPGHITTAVSASAGANFWLYLLAAFLTLPKQFAIVYLGSAFGTKSTKNTLISTAVMIVTIIGTVIAAGYIYYQMRLVMRRKALLIPVAAVPLGDQPTWADVANAEQIARRQSHMAGHNQKIVIVSPDGHVASPISLNPTMLRARDHDHVFPDRVSALRGYAPTRAWSVGHAMTPEEYQEWISRNQREASPSVAPSSTLNDDPVPDLLKWQDSFRDTYPVTGPLSAGARLTRDDTASSSATLLASPPRSNNGRGETDPLYPPPPVSPRLEAERPYSRGTVSLDLGRTNSNPSRVSGRQIADDADLYAYVRGGRRPDFGRMRGDSGAALLREGREREGSVGSDDAPTDGGRL